MCNNTENAGIVVGLLAMLLFYSIFLIILPMAVESNKKDVMSEYATCMRHKEFQNSAKCRAVQVEYNQIEFEKLWKQEREQDSK